MRWTALSSLLLACACSQDPSQPTNPPQQTAHIQVDWCRLQSPTSLSTGGNTATNIYARLFVRGLTDTTAGNDPLPGVVIGEVGVGSDGSEPSASSWQWSRGTPNPDWDAATADAATHDEYVAVLVAPEAPGNYDFAFRFSGDQGLNWTFCDQASGLDGEDGSENGYQTANAGHLTVTALSGTCAPNPCKERRPECMGSVAVTYEVPGECLEREGGGYHCRYEEASRTDCAQAGMVCTQGGCIELALAKSGEVIFSEIMSAPAFDLSEELGEYLEIYNTCTQHVSLKGCTLSNAAGETTVIGPLTLPAGAYALFTHAVAETPTELEPDHSFDFALGDVADAITLSCGATHIDTVAYEQDSGGFPLAPGAALSLDPQQLDAQANDSGESWCLASSVWHRNPAASQEVHRGTPGRANDPCSYVVERCRLQWPLEIKAQAGTEVRVFARLLVPGLTDQSTFTDPMPGIVVGELGIGPDGSNPELEPESWTWLPAEPNSIWDAATVSETQIDFDEYMATLVVPSAAGLYDYAFRFSGDAGRTFLYCDAATGDPGEDGSENGYQVAQAGDLRQDPCSPDPCPELPPRCEEQVAVVYHSPGTCKDLGQGAYECVVEEKERVDCGLVGKRCYEGICMVPWPQAGEVIFTEIMLAAEDEEGGEWVELLSTASGPTSLDGCYVSNNEDGEIALAGLSLAPGDYAVLANVATALEPGQTSIVFDFSLQTESRTLSLRCEDTPIDTLIYAPGLGFQLEPDRALNLDVDHHDAQENDHADAWCPAHRTYAAGASSQDRKRFGTPGAPNHPCHYEVDYCRLQWPRQVVAAAEESFLIFGRVRIAGLSDLSHGTVTAPGVVLAQVGVGPQGSDINSRAWSWLAAVANPAWGLDAPTYEKGIDEYMGELSAPVLPGAYLFAYRFSADNGNSWVLCDRKLEQSDASADGFQPEHAGELTVDPCVPNPCTEDQKLCDADELVVQHAPGICHSHGEGEYTCTYEHETRQDCRATLERCDPASPACVACLVHTDCIGWPLQICTGDHLCAAGCEEDIYEPADGEPLALHEGFEADNLVICDGGEDTFALQLQEGVEISAGIAFAHANGNLDLELLRGEDLVVVASSRGEVDGEQIDYEVPGSAGGTYLVRVFAADSMPNSYALSIALPWRLAEPGDLVISEIMAAPSGIDTESEWFELFNASEGTLNLWDVQVRNAHAESFHISADVLIDAGGHIVLGVNQDLQSNGHVEVAYTYDGFTLREQEEEVSLWRQDELLDSVAWTQATLHASLPAASIQLDPSHYNVDANDQADAWCPATAPWHEHDRGSPGQRNEPCVSFTIGWCNVQWPRSILAGPLGRGVVYSRLWVPGLTDTSPTNNTAPQLVAQVGIGFLEDPPHQEPEGWMWFDATANPGWNGDAAHYPNNDEYMAELVAPEQPGTYAYAYRYSGDSGVHWRYCDLGDTTWGEPPAQVPQLTVQAEPFTYEVQPSLSIPDEQPSGVTSTIVVSDWVRIAALSVEVAIDHDDATQLMVELQHPQGTIVRLHEHTGAGAFDVVSYPVPTAAAASPGALTELLDLSAKGPWTLRVADSVAGVEGTVLGWSMEIASRPGD